MKKSGLLIITLFILLTMLLITACAKNDAPVTTKTVVTTQVTTQTESTVTTSSVVTTKAAVTESPATAITPITDAPVTMSEFEIIINERIYLTPNNDPALKQVDDRNEETGETVKEAIFFGYKAEARNFTDEYESDGTTVLRYGISYLKPSFAYLKIKDSQEDYQKYDVSYFATKDWWQIKFKLDGIDFVANTTYEIILVIDTDDPEATHTDSAEGYYIWEDYTYIPPTPISSEYFNVSEEIPDIYDRKQLKEHASFSLQSDGTYRFAVKTDEGEFSDSGSNYGISYLTVEKCYINGEEVECTVSSTTDWWQIFFSIPNYSFQSGTAYEIVITLASTDGKVYTNYDGYFIQATYACP